MGNRSNVPAQRRRKISGHGSTTKAGKMRSQQPKNWGTSTRQSQSHYPLRHIRKHKIPRVAKRRNYEKRVLLKRKSGQNWMRER